MTDKSPRSSHVATAVAPVSHGFMKLGAALEAACADAGLVQTSHVRLLGTEEKWAAVEIAVAVDEAQVAEARAALRATFSGRADIALLRTRNRKKRLLISDMDSTIIEQECLDELAAYAGLKDEIAAITARAMAGELDFEGALTERVGKLDGLALTALPLLVLLTPSFYCKIALEGPCYFSIILLFTENYLESMNGDFTRDF